MTLKVNDFETLEGDTSVPQRASLKKLAYQVLLSEKISSPVNLIFCMDNFIHQLNFSFRKMNKPTDVLSFSYQEKTFWGEIYISVETAERQSIELKHSLLKELKKLVIHGCLHLAGWDHQTDEEEKAMQKREHFFLKDPLKFDIFRR